MGVDIDLDLDVDPSTLKQDVGWTTQLVLVFEFVCVFLFVFEFVMVFVFKFVFEFVLVLAIVPHSSELSRCSWNELHVHLLNMSSV